MKSTQKHLFASFVDLTMKSQSEDELIFGVAVSPNILFNSVCPLMCSVCWLIHSLLILAGVYSVHLEQDLSRSLVHVLQLTYCHLS